MVKIISESKKINFIEHFCFVVDELGASSIN